jgi:hypothetical protein
VAQLVEALYYKVEGRRIDSRIYIILPPHYGLVVDPASSINEYQEYFLRNKGGRCVVLTTLPPSCADCHEIWTPRISGNPRACPDLHRDCFTFFSTAYLLIIV